MRTIDIALKDIRQILRDRRSLLFFLVMPVIFTYFFGFAFRSSGSTADNRLPVGIVNHDPGGSLTGSLITLLEASETVRPVMIAENEAQQVDSQVVNERVGAVLVIPAGFSAATLQGQNPSMEMIINEETGNGQTARRALQTAITRVIGISQAAQSSLKAYEARAGALAGTDRTAYLEDAVSRGSQAWKAVPLGITTAMAEDPTRKTNPLVANPYNQFSPGMIVQFAFFGLMQAAMVMVVERRTGAMARLLIAPVNKAQLIGGHILGMFLVFFTQQLLLVLFGQFVLKVDYFRQPLATLLVMASLALWVAASGLLIAALVKKEEQVVLFSMIGMFVFSALGGSWFSLEMVGGAFAKIGHLMPSAWVIDGYQNIILRQLGFESVLLPSGIVLAYAVAFFALAVWKFRYE
jgi:ABC-2 type transport system permease protein